MSHSCSLPVQIIMNLCEVLTGPRRRRQLISGMTLASLCASLFAIAAPAAAMTSGANGTHDPSRMIVSNGKFYVYSTGGGSKWSTDGLLWTEGPAIFPSGIPSSTTSLVSSNEGVWAPDVIFVNGQYYLYYAIANAENACAIGLVTSPTLDPSSPDYTWTDRGAVVSNTGSATFCAIDPCPQLDASGNLWLTFGSGYTKPSSDNTIYLLPLDKTTGLPSSPAAAPGTPLEPGHIEASYVYYHGGYYYLFWNSGGCCSGASSTYEIHVARSTTISGPYTGEEIFFQSSSSMHGPGQIGIYDQCGADRFTYHYYPDTGGSVLGENDLTWSSEGWPVAGADSTTALTPCAESDAGDGGPSGDAGGDAGMDATPEGGTSEQKDAAIDVGGMDAGGSMDATSHDASRDSGGSTATPGGSSSGGSSSGCSCSTRGRCGGDEGLLASIVLGMGLTARRRSRKPRTP